MKCNECDTECGKELFCSIECACYSGLYNIRSGWNVSQDTLKQLKHIRDMEQKGYTTNYCDY